MEEYLSKIPYEPTFLSFDHFYYIILFLNKNWPIDNSSFGVQNHHNILVNPYQA